MDKTVNLQAKIVRGDEAARYTVLGVQHLIRLSGADTANTLTLLELILPPDAGIPLHVHSREDEVFHVLEGAMEFTIAGRQMEAVPGTTAYGPRGLPHACRAGARGARTLVAIVPAGVEKMFVELAQLGHGQPDLAQVAEICSRYGVSLGHSQR